MATEAANAAEEALDRRDAAIVAAYLAGNKLRAIADAVGLTHPGVGKILDRKSPDGSRLTLASNSMSVRSPEPASTPPWSPSGGQRTGERST